MSFITTIPTTVLCTLAASLVSIGTAQAQLIKPQNEVEVEYDPSFDWESPSSYDWSSHQGPGNAENMANHIRLTRAIQREFDSRNIKPDTVKASLLVMYEVTRGKEVRGTSTYGRTVDPSNQRTNVAIDSVEVGNLKITIFDGETHRTLWEASLKQQLLTPDKSEKQINQAVAKMFAKFPIAKKEEK